MKKDKIATVVKLVTAKCENGFGLGYFTIIISV